MSDFNNNFSPLPVQPNPLPFAALPLSPVNGSGYNPQSGF